jgi:hypothetical protein
MWALIGFLSVLPVDIVLLNVDDAARYLELPDTPPAAVLTRLGNGTVILIGNPLPNSLNISSILPVVFRYIFFFG